MNAFKTLFLICICLTALSWKVIGQSPTITPDAAPARAAISPAATASPSPTDESDLERAIQNKLKRHLHVTIGDHDVDKISDHFGDHDGDIPGMVGLIVAITMFTVFGAPVLIVAVILYFSMSKSRQLHKTVRMMVEKGQEVPAALLAAPPVAQRQRSDMRRGVVLVMVGLGIMLFFAAVNEWEGGAWSIGLIPFFIGLGYLLVWKLDTKKDNPPPLP